MKNLNRIKVILAEKNLTQVWLAGQLNRDIRTVNMWCTNKRQPSVEDLYRISVQLDVDVSELLNPTKSVIINF